MATRTFPLPADRSRKSALYNGPVADAAIAVIGDVVACAADAAFAPTPLEGHPAAVGRLRRAMGQEPRPGVHQRTRCSPTLGCWKTVVSCIVKTEPLSAPFARRYMARASATST